MSVRSHNLASFANRFFNEPCRYWHIGDSTGTEIGQIYPTIPTMLRRALQRHASGSVLGFRTNSWINSTTTYALQSAIPLGQTIAGTAEVSKGSLLNYDLTGAANFEIVGKFLMSNSFGTTTRIPFAEPVPWNDPAGFMFRFTHHRTPNTVDKFLLRPITGSSPYPVITLKNSTDKSASGVFTEIADNYRPPTGVSPGLNIELQYQHFTVGGNGGTHFAEYAVEIAKAGYDADDVGMFFCGGRSRGGDMTINHLEPDYINGYTGGPAGVYTNDDLQFEINPGGDIITPNTFVVHILNSYTPTEGGYFSAPTAAQSAAIKQHYHDMHDRLSAIMALAGTPIQDQRWLYLAPYAAYGAGNVDSDLVDLYSKGRADAIAEFAKERGSEVSYLNLEGLIRSRLGNASQWHAAFLDDEIHPNFNYVDTVGGTRSFVDYFGATVIQELQSASLVPSIDIADGADGSLEIPIASGARTIVGWPTTAATLTGTIRWIGQAVKAVTGAIAYRESIGGRNYHEWAYNAADRPALPTSGVLTLTDGNITKTLDVVFTDAATAAEISQHRMDKLIGDTTPVEFTLTSSADLTELNANSQISINDAAYTPLTGAITAVTNATGNVYSIANDVADVLTTPGIVRYQISDVSGVLAEFTVHWVSGMSSDLITSLTNAEAFSGVAAKESTT